MSDRETIIHAIRTAQSRIRRTQFMERTVSVLIVFAGIGVLARLLNLVVVIDPATMRYFWLVWIAGLAITLLLKMLQPGPRDRGMNDAASSLDHRAHLNDEVLSAWWFLSHERGGPWIELQIRKAAERARALNVGELFPLRAPRGTWLAMGGLAGMIVLQFVPIPFVPNLLLSEPPLDAEVTEDRDAQLDEIEQLLREARELNTAMNQDLTTIEEFERLVESMRDQDLSLADTRDQAEAVEALIDEGNLNANNLLEGLEQMGSDLRRAEETQAAGEALSQGDLETAAREFEALAEQLASSEAVSDALPEALNQAAENARTGLEDLAAALEEAADSLQNQDGQAASEAMMEAAESIDDLSALVESQQLQNQAAQQMDELREAARQQENASGQPPPPSGAAGESAGESAGEGDPSGAGGPAQSGQAGAGDTAMPPEALQPGSNEGSEGTPGDPSDAEAPEGAVPSMSGNTQGGIDPSGTGQIPTGLGFSPEQKTGEATSLDVQLEMESTAAAAGESMPAPEPEERREEATRQERSRLDYRSLPTDLSPAQQELLNQDRIPREYRNVIREYFQAIRPQAEDSPSGGGRQPGPEDD